jgi:hypothetical protein
MFYDLRTVDEKVTFSNLIINFPLKSYSTLNDPFDLTL